MDILRVARYPEQNDWYTGCLWLEQLEKRALVDL